MLGVKYYVLGFHFFDSRSHNALDWQMCECRHFIHEEIDYQIVNTLFVHADDIDCFTIYYCNLNPFLHVSHISIWRLRAIWIEETLSDDIFRTLAAR